MLPTRPLIPAFCIALALGGSASAQTQPTPEQAHALEAQITGWLTAATGGSVALPPQPVQLTPEGDHYLVRVPLAPLGASVEPPDAAFTGKARQLGGTRWALDDQQFPPEMTVRTTETVPDPPDAKNPSQDGTHREDVTYRIKLGQQDGHGVFDTSLATPTTSGGTIASVDIEKEGGMGASLTHIGQLTTETSSRPVDPGHSDLLSDVSATGYSTRAEMQDGTETALQADRLHVVTALSGLAHDQLLPLVHLVADLANMLKASGSDVSDGATPEQRAKLHAMLEKAHAILTGGKLDETVEGAKLDVAGNAGSFTKAEISFDGDAPGDTLSASMGLSVDGLVVDALPPQLAAYVPTHFAIHPTLSNLSLSALTRMGLDATAPDSSGQPPDVASLFGKGGIKFGFDTLALDIAGTHLTGTGAFTSTGPASVAGQANLTARGLDALIAKAQSDPVLAQAVPVVIFLKGIARTSGDQSVWQVTVDNAKVLVNGVDLSALTGGMAK